MILEVEIHKVDRRAYKARLSTASIPHRLSRTRETQHDTFQSF